MYNKDNTVEHLACFEKIAIGITLSLINSEIVSDFRNILKTQEIIFIKTNYYPMTCILMQKYLRSSHDWTIHRQSIHRQ